MPDKGRVAALVVTYNRRALLEECLAAVLGQEAPVDTVVVVDNASTDGTEGLFGDGGRFSAEARVVYRRMPENLGGAGGFKEGLRVASGTGCDWVWLMDDDCIPEPGTLGALLAASAVPEEAPSFLASCVFGPEGEPMNVPAVSGRLHENGYSDWCRHLNEGLVEIRSATFVSLLINSQAIERVGLPIGSFFIWGDDVEYTTRLATHFAPAYLVGSSKVLHKRANAKALTIFNEDDPGRIAMHRYHVRNNLIVARLYATRLGRVKALLGAASQAVKCLTRGPGGPRVRLLRFRATSSGIAAYLTGRYELEDYATHVRTERHES